MDAAAFVCVRATIPNAPPVAGGWPIAPQKRSSGLLRSGIAWCNAIDSIVSRSPRPVWPRCPWLRAYAQRYTSSVSDAYNAARNVSSQNTKRRAVDMQRHRGFTLIELLVVIAIM